VRSVKGKIINLLVVAKYALAEVRRLLPGGQSTPQPGGVPAEGAAPEVPGAPRGGVTRGRLLRGPHI